MIAMIDQDNPVNPISADDSPGNAQPGPESEEAPKPEEVEAEVSSGSEKAAPGEAVPEAGSEVEEPLSFDELELEVESSESPTNVPADWAAQLEELTQKVKTLELTLEQKETQSKRIAADFDNFRKRTQKEREELEQAVRCATIVEVLPVVDNFERAKEQLKPQTEEAINIHKSYQGIYKQFVDCLKRVGVSPMRAEGQAFDPMLHDAMLREPTEQYPEGTVMQELQRGYLLGDRVLRHAMVKVAAAPESVIPSEEDQPIEEPEAS